MTIIAVRHLEDLNALSTFGFDGPLVAGQEGVAFSIAEAIKVEAQNLGVSEVCLLYSPQKRSIETARLIGASLQNVTARFQEERGLEEVQQGVLKLPNGYVDGTMLDYLDTAWWAFRNEAYGKQNLSFRFGEGEAKVHFENIGECRLDHLPRQYELLCRVINGEVATSGELVVLVAHSSTIFVLYELYHLGIQLMGQQLTGIEPSQLPRACWEVSQRCPPSLIPDKLSYGKVAIFDSLTMRRAGIAELLARGAEHFANINKGGL